MGFTVLKILLFGPGVRYVPEIVWRSKFFWIAIAVTIVGSILYHNNFFKNPKFMDKSFNLKAENEGSNAVKILYADEGRCGHVWYQSAETKFAMYYEFGSGNCVTNIDIPSLENWEKETKLPLAQRDEVLDFIGHQVVKDQTTSGKGYFKIEGNWLNIYV